MTDEQQKKAIELLVFAREWLNDTHGYDSQLFYDICDFLDKEIEATHEKEARV